MLWTDMIFSCFQALGAAPIATAPAGGVRLATGANLSPLRLLSARHATRRVVTRRHPCARIILGVQGCRHLVRVTGNAI